MTDHKDPIKQATLPLTLPAASQSRPIGNFADLLTAIESDKSIAEAKRIRLSTQIRTAARVATTTLMRKQSASVVAATRDVVLSQIPCDISWLNAHLFAYPPMSAARIKPATFQNVISGLRCALDHVGLLPPKSDALPSDAKEWKDALAALTAYNEKSGLALNRFAPWCHAQGIMPGDVTTETLARFRDYADTHYLGASTLRMVQSATKAMRKIAGDANPGLANLRSPRRREPYTLPLERFPESLRANFNAFLDRYAGKTTASRSPFRGDGPPRTLSPTTVEARAFSLKQALAGLVLSGRDPATITSLSVLVEEDAFMAILHHFWQRAIDLKVQQGMHSSAEDAPNETGVTEQTGAIAGVLMILARYYLKLPEDKIGALNSLAADVTSSQNTSIRQKNLDRLRQYDNPKTRSDLLHLPQTLMRRVRDAAYEGSQLDRARLARTAISIEILLNSPIRL